MVIADVARTAWRTGRFGQLAAWIMRALAAMRRQRAIRFIYGRSLTRATLTGNDHYKNVTEDHSVPDRARLRGREGAVVGAEVFGEGVGVKEDHS